MLISTWRLHFTFGKFFWGRFVLFGKFIEAYEDANLPSEFLLGLRSNYTTSKYSNAYDYFVRNENQTIFREYQGTQFLSHIIFQVENFTEVIKIFTSKTSRGGTFLETPFFFHCSCPRKNATTQFQWGRAH